MPELRETLERALPRVSSDSSTALANVLKLAARRRRQRRAMAIGAATVAVAILVIGTLRAVGGTSESVAAEVDAVLGGAPLQSATGFGSIWVTICQRDCQRPQSSGQLVRVDSHTGRIVQRFATANPGAFAITDGSLWIANFWTGQVTRMDPHTGRITQTISLTLPTPVAPGDRRFLPSSMSAGRGVVWVGTARGWLAQINARSGRVLSMVRAPFDATGRIVVGPHGLWVAESVLGVGFVPRNGARLTVRVVPSGRRRHVAVDELAVGDGRVWIYGVIAEPAGFAPGGFVLTNSAEVATLDESTGRITHQMRFRAGPYQIVYGNGALFAADFRSGQLYRIDPSYRVQSLRPVRGPGTLVAVTPGAIWATTASGTLRRLSVPGA